MKLKDNPIIQKLAKELGLPRIGDAEQAIREFCVRRIEQIIEPFDKLTDLGQFLSIVSSSLRLKFEEVWNDHDLVRISKEYLAKGEIIFGILHKQLDEETDAILISLAHVETRESKYIAVIDCRGHKASRAYFSKWHEVGHVLTLPAQMSFKFRRTPSWKKDPEEQIVDRVAGDLAFYSPLFLPELLARVRGERRLTFQVIEELRTTVCPGASREATIRGAVARIPFPQVLVIANMGLKRDEQRTLTSLQMRLFPENEIPFEPKLRAVDVIGNTLASNVGLRIHPNMEVPLESVIADAFEDTSFGTQVLSGVENLNWWKHSRGQLDNIPIRVEAMKAGNRVLALISQEE
jgi:hypothetical protein